jgi:hypothetical protein
VASGDSCCRLAAAVAGLGCQLSPAWLRELQRQVRGGKRLGQTTARCACAVDAEAAMTANAVLAQHVEQLLGLHCLPPG